MKIVPKNLKLVFPFKIHAKRFSNIELQLKLFEMGCTWASGEKISYPLLGPYYYITTNKKITYGNSYGDSYFKEHEYQEISEECFL